MGLANVRQQMRREEGFKFFHVAATVIEGGAVHTRNLCKQCNNDRQQKQGEQPVKAARWRELMEQKSLCGKLWVAFGMEQYVRRVWERFTVKTAWAKPVLSDANKDMQEGMQGNWQKRSPFKEELELVRRGGDLSFDASNILRWKVRELGKLQGRISKRRQSQCV